MKNVHQFGPVSMNKHKSMAKHTLIGMALKHTVIKNYHSFTFTVWWFKPSLLVRQTWFTLEVTVITIENDVNTMYRPNVTCRLTGFDSEHHHVRGSRLHPSNHPIRSRLWMWLQTFGSHNTQDSSYIISFQNEWKISTSPPTMLTTRFWC